MDITELLNNNIDTLVAFKIKRHFNFFFTKIKLNIRLNY